jgi:AcrR family transcriptional regulator
VAARTVKEGRFEQMTIRSLAADLGVAPMTLYRHVRDKDDVLDEVADHLLAQKWRPRYTGSHWRTWVAEAAERLRDLLISQPVALHVYLRHPVVSPAALTRMETMLEVLRNSGFDEPAARRAYASIHTYTIGFAALEASRARWSETQDPSDATMKELAAFTRPKQFTDGLADLLDGIDARRKSGSGKDA